MLLSRCYHIIIMLLSSLLSSSSSLLSLFLSYLSSSSLSSLFLSLYSCLMLDFDAEGEGAADVQVRPSCHPCHSKIPLCCHSCHLPFNLFSLPLTLSHFCSVSLLASFHSLLTHFLPLSFPFTLFHYLLLSFSPFHPISLSFSLFPFHSLPLSLPLLPPQIQTGKMRISIGESVMACLTEEATVENCKRYVRA